MKLLLLVNLKGGCRHVVACGGWWLNSAQIHSGQVLVALIIYSGSNSPQCTHCHYLWLLIF